jgi:hypothetical protein
MLKCSVHLFCLCACFSFSLHSNETGHDKKLHTLERQIVSLKAALNSLELDRENKEAASQKYMIAEWGKFSDEMVKVQGMDKREESLASEIKELERQKSELLKQKSP